MLHELSIFSGLVKDTLDTVFLKSFWLPADRKLPVSSLPKPIGITFEVTDACNSRCQSCNIWQTPDTKELVTPEEMSRLLRDPLFEKLESMIITGGEATLRPDLIELMVAIHDARPKAQLTLSTNALLPQRTIDTVKALLARDIPVVVGISLEALGEKHDYLRGVPGNFMKVDGLIRDLHKLGKARPGMLRITIPQCISPETATEVQEVDQYCDMMGANHLIQLYEEFSYYSNTPETMKDLKYKSHIEGALGHYLSPEEKYAKYPIHPLQVLGQLPPGPQNEFLMKSIKSNKPFLRKSIFGRNFCSSLSNFFLLRANGDVAPCLRWSHLRYANIRNSTPTELWTSSRLGEGRKMVRECSGCSNSWAVDWSSRYWFFPLFPMLVRAYLKRKITHRKTAKSLGRPITLETPNPLPLEEIEQRMNKSLRAKPKEFKFQIYGDPGTQVAQNAD